MRELGMSTTISAVSSRWSQALPKSNRAGDTLLVTAPYDGSLMAELPVSNLRHVERCLQTAYRLHRSRADWLSLSERIGVLERAAKIMMREKVTLATTAAQEGGKPLPDSQVEVERAIDGLRLCVDHLRTSAGSVVPMGASQSSSHRLAFTHKEPIGVVVAVSAFNHPLNLIVHQVAAAVAAGCPVVVKPAPDTPLSCLVFVSILHEAGLPKERCQVVVTPDIATSEALVTDSRVAFFSFIGSPKVGWMLRSKLAPGARCALEHGGAAPVILLQDADHLHALDRITKGGFYHAGQVCVSVQRVYVPAGQAREFAEALGRRADDLKLGDPRRMDTEVGPLIREGEVKRVHRWVCEAVEEGATLVAGGEALGASMYRPTVLLNPSLRSKVSCQEIFGPVVCVYEYEQIDQAINAANDLPFAFQAAVFTQDLDNAFHVSRKIDASAVMINDDTAFRIDGMPFAGLRESGLGVGGIPYSIDDMQVEKMLVFHSKEL